MAESTQTFILVGQFKDGITPSLRKLNTQISALTKTFGRFSKQLRPISKELGVMAMASERMAKSQKANRGVFEGNIRVMREYKKAIGEVGRAHTALSKKTPKSVVMPRIREERQAMRGRGGVGGGGLPSAAAMVAGERAGDKGMGFWGMTAAMATANIAVQAATTAFHKLTGSLQGFVMGGAQAEQAVIQMSGTLMTLGKVGNFAKSREMADAMMGELGKVAAALPGSTEDYLSILQQTLDDQIEAFGSVEAVNKNLAGIDIKTGQKLAGGAEQSFTALMGMTAQLAGMRPEIAAMDLVQLRQNPENIRQVQLLTRNPTLAKFYKEELKKAGGNYIMALNEAMKRAIPAEQIEALKNSFDSAYQSFITTFTDKYGGIFAPMRKVKIKVFKSAFGFQEETVTTMDLMGQIMRSINEILSMVMGMNLMDPMKVLADFLYEVLVWFHMAEIMLEKLQKETALNLANLAEVVGNLVGVAIANLTNYVMNLDYEKFFKNLDKIVYAFFKGLFEGFLKAFTGVTEGNKGPLGALGTSVSGTIVVLGLATIAFKKLVSTIELVRQALMGLLGGGGGGGGRAPADFGPGGRKVNRDWTGGIRRTGKGGSLSRLNRMRRYKMGQAASFVGELGGLGYNMMGRPGSKMAGGAMKGLRGGFRGLTKAGRFIPGGALAMGALDAGVSIASGENPGKAIGSAVAGVLGAAAGSIFGPVGTVIGGIAGPMLFDAVAGSFQGPKSAQERAAEAQAAAAAAMDKATDSANARFLKESQYLQGVQAIADRFGGGAGLRAALEDPGKVKQMGLSPEDAQQTKILAGYMSQLNVATQNREKAEAAAVQAEKANTGDKIKLRALADKAAKDQIALESKMRKAWESTSTSSQNKLLQAAGAMAKAITAASKSLRVGATSPGGVDPTSQNRARPGRPPSRTPGSVAETAFNGSPGKRMGLAEAIQTEMKNKPSGSHLVIANSSETVIPAFGGFSPLGSMANALVKFIAPLNALKQMADENNMMDGILGNASGNLAAAAALAKQYGLTMTSFQRSGPPNASYHNVGRAMDFSNSTGPTPQMMAFAQAMASQYGSSMAELIYTPLGYGIKHGRKVPPYAASGHYNHVHVAFANGLDMPRLFTSAAAAANYERMMAPSGARVATVTANSSEFGGGAPVTLNQTVNVDGSGDPRATAEAVWALTAKAVQQLQANNYG